MNYFHLSYDNSKIEAKDVVKLLRDNFSVTLIGRPVESTLIFMMPSSSDDDAQLLSALDTAFVKKNACYVISRVDSMPVQNTKQVHDHISVKAAKDHEKGLDDDIKVLNNDGLSSLTLKNLKAPYAVLR